MGRQTALVATLEDERAFLAFLRGTATIRIFESSAASIEKLEVTEFAPVLPYHGQYFIWNTAFPWVPEFGSVDHPKAPAASRGRVFVSNFSVAPVLEYDRAVPEFKRAGRVYWSKYFSAPAGVTYDVEGFSRWYDQIVYWIRKTGKERQFGSGSAYLLPDALKNYP